MDFNEIARKINDFEKDLTAVKDQLTTNLADTFEVKSLENHTNSEDENFVHFIRTGEMKNGTLMEFKAQKGSLEAGMPVAPNSSNLIAFYLDKFSVMRKLCKFQLISSDSFDVIIDENGGKATWGTPDENEPFVKKYIKTYELVAEPKATSKLIEDVRIDVEKFMAEKIAESFAIAEDDAFLNGTGIEEPKGILALEKGKNVNAIERLDGKLETSAIKDLIDSINPFYGQNLSFLISKDVESKIKSLKEENGRHIWQARLLEAERNTIFGIPVFVSNFMPSNQILFGNFEKGYTIVEKFGNYMMRDPYTKRPFIKFYTSKKIGGDVIDGNAFKILNIKPS